MQITSAFVNRKNRRKREKRASSRSTVVKVAAKKNYKVGIFARLLRQFYTHAGIVSISRLIIHDWICEFEKARNRAGKIEVAFLPLCKRKLFSSKSIRKHVRMSRSFWSFPILFLACVDSKFSMEKNVPLSFACLYNRFSYTYIFFILKKSVTTNLRNIL